MGINTRICECVEYTVSLLQRFLERKPSILVLTLVTIGGEYGNDNT